MPITKSAKKALRSSLKKKAGNLIWKKNMKDSIKKIEKLAKEKVGEKGEEVKNALSQAYKMIDKTAKSGIIKKNNASRKKSRLARMVK